MSTEDNDGFWQRRAEPDEVVAGRYRGVDPVTGREASWTRVTTFNETYAETYGLERWQCYRMLDGLARRPDLRALVATLEPGDPGAREIVDQALEAGAHKADANEGTAAHRALCAAALGLEYPQEYAVLVESFRRELARCGLAVVPGMVEVLLHNADLGVRGRADLFLVDAAGRVVLADVKTGRLDRAELQYRIQFACYARATHFLPRDVREPAQRDDWQPMPVGEQAVRDDVAVLVKVDLEQMSCSAYAVDLAAGQRSANLARAVREDRRLGGTLLPYVPPTVAQALDRAAHATIAGNGSGQPLGLANVAAPMVGETRVSGDVVQQFDGASWETIGPAMTTQPALPSAAVPTIPAPTAPPPGKTCGTCGGVPQTREQLKKLDKASLQRLCREHGVTESLAKNKDPLVDYLAAKGHVEGEAGPPVGTGPTPKLGDPAEIVGPIGGADPTVPGSPEFEALFLREIGNAGTIADLGAIHARVIRLGGQQAWSPAIDAAAKARAAAIEAPVDGPAYRTAIGREQEPAAASAIRGPLELIAQAETVADVADIWRTVTLGGTQPERWTQEVGQAAQAKVVEIEARPAAPAVNPFARTPGVTP